MNYSEFHHKNFPQALALANKYYSLKHMSLIDYDTKVKMFASDIIDEWYSDYENEHV
jgi:hypothetical protein